MTKPAQIIPVILSGGAGTRLWPKSRPEMPKQMLALTAEHTMLQLTAARVRDARFSAPIVVASTGHAGLVEQQLGAIGVPPRALILEPMGRNTAPAIALAALAAEEPGALLLVMPSDHVIADVPAFHAAIGQALPLAEEGWLITFGITPDAPETGYGYIRAGEEVAPGVHRVDRFVEKPPLETAKAMLAEGGHVWNGGIFLFRADAYLDALRAYEPEMLDAVERAVTRARREGARVMPDADAFAAARAESIDYAVMERASRVAVVSVTMGWNDVGSWDALHAISMRDDDGNVFQGDVTALESTGCLVNSDRARVALLGVHDLIVVASGDDILILPRGRSQEVKALLEKMKT
ncbi:MAG: mannose-1-phosphate guanylyltransferase/mannose-6-phosphate isomerase [Sphingomonas bacterium]